LGGAGGEGRGVRQGDGSLGLFVKADHPPLPLVAAQGRRGLLYVAIFITVVYGADYLAAKTNPLGSVQVQPYLAIHLKNKKTEFDFDVPTQTQSCVASFAPHMGYPPCWYLKKRTVQRIDD
jgi:hypothetical protein